MSYETIRISELAKELGLQSKEVLDKFSQIGVTGKTHSSTVTVDQIRRLKDFISNGGVKKASKPKAFVVKKPKVEQVVESVSQDEEKPIVDSKEVTEPVSKVEKVERPKVQVVKPVSRLEIVRRAPRKSDSAEGSSSERLAKKAFDKKRPDKNNGDKRPPRGDKPLSKDSKDFSNKKPIERRIIPQEIYENKPGINANNSKRRNDGKKKDKEFSKKEEQERISLEKAAAQHHKKKTQRTEEVEEITQIVVT
ncbi:MAG: translation initiation factor IF-2 N-terminal domain-containing protein, partial [Clostridia bacterium]|nr:translation initiation factor IF-2 N-terminal domain-containing protein [Clostridia bacterium]